MLWIILLLIGLGFIVRSYVTGRRPHLAFMAGLGLVAAAFLAPGVAGASSLEEPTPVGPDAVQADSVLNLPPYVVSLLLGALIPLLTGLLTKVSTPSWVKYGVTSLLSAVAGLVNVSLTDGGGAVISWSSVSSAAVTWIIANVAYQGWRTVGATSSMVTRVDSSGTEVREPGSLATVGVK